MKHSLLQFREQVYQNFNKRADGLLEVVDALSGQQDVRSVAELSLAASFQRTYSSLYKSIAACSLSNADLAGLGASQLPAPAKRNFWLLATDVSSHPRRYSDKLADRGCVYEPTVIPGNAPVTLGRQYSTGVGLPEKEAAEAAWVLQQARLSLPAVSTNQPGASYASAPQSRLLPSTYP